MTDLPLHPSEELASRYLDGDLDAVERDRAESDPDVMSLVEAMSGVRSALRELPAVDPALGDRVIAAALTAFDEFDAEGSPAPVGSRPVVSLQARRQRRFLTWAGGAVAAAAVAVIAVGVGPRLGSEGDDDLVVAPAATQTPFDAADQPSDMAVREAEEAVDLEAAAGAVPAEGTDAMIASDHPAGDGGELATDDDLRTYLLGHPLPQQATCPLSIGQSAHGVASYGGVLVEMVYDVAADTITLVSLDGCEPVITVARVP